MTAHRVGNARSAEDADALAARLLGDRCTALGDRHIEHARRVAAGALAVDDPRMVAAALLHDVLEKSNVERAQLLELTGDAEVVELVDILTHRRGESYTTYLSRCAGDPDALLLKRLDLADKLTADGSQVPPDVAERVRRRARRRLALLERLAGGPVATGTAANTPSRVMRAHPRSAQRDAMAKKKAPGSDGASGLESVASTFTHEQLVQLVGLLGQTDSVELKLSVPDAERRSTVAALEMDPLDAQIRQVVFFDTPDLTLSDHGLVVRARRVQRRAGDSVVKLRPLVPDQLPASVRRSSSFGVEVDAMPGGFVCSGSMKAEADNSMVHEVVAGKQPIRKLFTKEQRALFAAHAPDGLALDDLAVLGPVNVLKLKLTPVGLGRRMVAELWFYPDGFRILELSTKCKAAEAFVVSATAKAFLTERGVDLLAEQQTKTKAALQFFTRELATAPATAAAPA